VDIGEITRFILFIGDQFYIDYTTYA